MFGQLDYDPNHPHARWTVSYFLTRDLTPPEIAPTRAVALGAAIGEFKAAVADLTPDELVALKAVAVGLPLDTIDPVSDLYLALAHLRLPPVQRAEREARIAGALDLMFRGTPTVPGVTAGIKHLKLLAPMAPDAHLEAMVRSHGARLQMVHMTVPAWAVHFAEPVQAVDALARALGIASRSPADGFLMCAWFSRPPAERPAFIELLEHAVERSLGDAVVATQAALAPRGLLMELDGGILVNVLNDGIAAGLKGPMSPEMGAIVDNQVALGCATDDARAQAVINATIDAVRAGVLMGPRVRRQNMAAIALANRDWCQQQLLMTPQRLRLRRKLATVPAPPNPAAPPDLDPVSSWSVGRLVRWIGGPIAERAPSRLDRRAALTQENTLRQQASASTRLPNARRGAEPVIDLGEAEIDWAVQDALSTTAGFFVGDIEDMLFRGQVVNCTSPAMSACVGLLSRLRDVRPGRADDDQVVRALLHEAEQALDALRSDIHTLETDARTRQRDARTRQRFAMQLQTALASEAMVEGKRHGGVIACPLQPDDWSWVAEQYHRRWLPWVRQIVVDGAPQLLQPDQAVGLYVTGRSLSGHAFDISVHLWQRKAGRQGAAGTDRVPFAPMNAADWFDTLTPCLVLHVPAAG